MWAEASILLYISIERMMMDEQDFDLDNLDNLLDGFDGVTVEGGVDTDKEDDACAGGACKI